MHLFPTSSFSDITLAAWNQPWWEYLPHRDGQILHIKFSPLESWLLNTYQHTTATGWRRKKWIHLSTKTACGMYFSETIVLGSCAKLTRSRRKTLENTPPLLVLSYLSVFLHRKSPDHSHLGHCPWSSWPRNCSVCSSTYGLICEVLAHLWAVPQLSSVPKSKLYLNSVLSLSNWQTANML